MPRDLFGDVSDPRVRVGSRKWYTVPLSLAAHTIVLLTIVIVPLLATGALPIPHESVTFAITPVKVPEPPAPPVRREPARETPRVNPNQAPVIEPTAISSKPPMDPGFEARSSVGVLPGGLDAVDTRDGVVAPPPPPLKPAPQEPVHVGGQIREPAKVTHVAPVYPAIAQAARISGVVIIEAVIGVDGRVQHVHVLRSVPLLDEAALSAVRQWVYTPTTLNGVPVAVIMTVTVSFQLQK